MDSVEVLIKKNKWKNVFFNYLFSISGIISEYGLSWRSILFIDTIRSPSRKPK